MLAVDFIEAQRVTEEEGTIQWKNGKAVATFFSRIAKVLSLLIQPCAYQKLYKCRHPSGKDVWDLRLLDSVGWDHGLITR